jgi:hypothetical protein
MWMVIVGFIFTCATIYVASLMVQKELAFSTYRNIPGGPCELISFWCWGDGTDEAGFFFYSPVRKEISRSSSKHCGAGVLHHGDLGVRHCYGEWFPCLHARHISDQGCH